MSRGDRFDAATEAEADLVQCLAAAPAELSLRLELCPGVGAPVCEGLGAIVAETGELVFEGGDLVAEEPLAVGAHAAHGLDRGVGERAPGLRGRGGAPEGRPRDAAAEGEQTRNPQPEQ